MSFYSPIDRRINADRWFRERTHLAQLLWFRLLTGTHVTPVAGLWPVTEAGLARAFGFTTAAFRRIFSELSVGEDGEPNGRVYADWDAGVIWFPRAIHIPANQPKNENTLRGWMKHIELVPECALRDEALTEIRSWVNSLPNRFPNGLPEGFPKPFKQPLPKLAKQHVPRANQDHEQEQEQETVQPPQRFAMHAGWEPTAQTMAALRVGMIPDWAIPEMVSRFRAHFCGDPKDLRTFEQWNQSCSKWVFGDWNNSKKRPKKPELEGDSYDLDEKTGALS